MTHRIEPGTYRNAILDTLAELLDREVAEATGRSKYHFYRIASPTNDQQLKHVEAAELARALKAKNEPDPFEAIYLRIRDNGDTETPYLDVAALHRATAEIGKEFGELSAAILKAGADDEITRDELNDVISELQDVLACGQKLMDDACKVRDAMERVVALRAAE